MTPRTPPEHDERRRGLKADCSRCVGLCCVALAYVRSADFGFDKPAGEPCVNLDDDFRCSIHPQLRERGFKGCTVFDCFGAGQQVTQVTFGGRSWRDAPSRELMFSVFPIMRQLHEMLWYLTAASDMPHAAPVYAELDRAYAATQLLAQGPPESIVALDVDAHRREVNRVLAQASALVRAAARPAGTAPMPRKVRAGADLIGARLALDLRGADLRGCLMIAADLRGCDLGGADVIGADFRDALVGGADLSESLFLTQFQVNAANGDADTKLPPWLERPQHWA
jgi:uncharacterized protein YjbI with pentapeptide repeats